MIRAFTFVLLLLLHVGHSFVVPFVPSAVSGRTRFSPSSASPSSSSLHAVLDIQSDQAFDKAIASADGLVVVDYSTTWCGPCKVIAPKFDALSDEYPSCIFLQVVGDSSSEASKLMKREAVRSVPAFHFFKGGKKIDVVNGANAEALESAIKKHSE